MSCKIVCNRHFIAVGLVLLILVPNVLALQEEANFAAEPYLLGYSVSNNASANTVPPLYSSPTDFIAFPAHIAQGNPVKIELFSIPLFDGLAQILGVGIESQIDSNTSVGFFGATVTNDNIARLPALQGTAEERAANPNLRPVACTECQTMKYVDYPMLLNLKRNFPFLLPTADLFARPIPIHISFGTNVKYLKSELEGDEEEYIAHNINLDAGVQIKVFWGHDIKKNHSHRNFGLGISGFELLPVPQYSAYAQEDIQRRYGIYLFWEEHLESLRSQFKLGIQQQSTWEKFPGLGLEWNYLKILTLKTGWQNDYLAAGASIRFKYLSVSYSFVQHELSYNPYQFALQLELPPLWR